MGKRRRIATGAAVVALSNAYANVLALEGVPDECDLQSLQAVLDTIAGGPTTLSWYLTEDVGGDYTYTDEV